VAMDYCTLFGSTVLSTEYGPCTRYWSVGQNFATIDLQSATVPGIYVFTIVLAVVRYSYGTYTPYASERRYHNI